MAKVPNYLVSPRGSVELPMSVDGVVVGTVNGPTETAFNSIPSFVTYKAATPAKTHLVAQAAVASIAASGAFFAFVAPFACSLTYAALVTPTAVTASDTVKWTVDVRSLHAGTPAIIVTQHTGVTGGTAIAANVPWPIVGTYDPTNQVLAAGDAVDFNFTKLSTAATLTNALLLVRYEPS